MIARARARSLSGLRSGALAVGTCVLAGCGGPAVNLPFDEPVHGAAALELRPLRFRREVGPPDRYQAQYSMRIRNDLEMDETVTAQLTYTYPGRNEGPPPHDRVVIWKQELKREFLEVMPNGDVSRQGNPRGMQPTVTPNTEAEPGWKGLRYIPFDDLGRILRRSETPFHFVWYDSLCYFWPILPAKPVRPGDRWNADVPVIVGREFSNNLMSLHATFYLAELRRLRARGGAGPLVAVIDYSYYGLLDTGAAVDAAKLPPNTPGLLWRRNAVEGTGKAYFDVERGKVIWKTERYSFTVERKTASVTRKDEGGAAPGRAARDAGVDCFRSVCTFEFSARLLGPGEGATDRPSRIE